MLKFNNDHIITGYIKQILSSFNLPKYRIYTRENYEYFKKYKKESPEIICTVEYRKNDQTNIDYKDGFPYHPKYIHYIKDGKIQDYIHDAKSGDHYWYDTGKSYAYNQFDINFTKHLKINNNIYDSYTHEYLGDFLRFLRDYVELDLMSMYNCFSDRICSTLYYAWEYIDAEGKTKKITIDAADTQYKIYMLPVKLFKKYTIAIDSSFPVELFCGVYNKYQDTREKLADIPKLTYIKYGAMNFNKPVVYTKLNDLSDIIESNKAIEIVQNEKDLKLFIKLPITNTSSIVVLEGDYTGFNDTLLKKYEATTKTIYISPTNKITVNKNEPNKINAGVGDTWLKLNDGSYFEPSLYEFNGTEWELVKNFENKTYTESDKLAENNITVKSGSILGYKASTNIIRNTNHFITNYEGPIKEDQHHESGEEYNDHIGYQEGQYFKPITPLQLLRINTNFSYPFADRLIEYLTQNAITNNDEISDNILRAQKVMGLDRKITKEDGTKINTTIPTNYPGIWESKMRPVFYDFINKDWVLNTNDTNHDILGYVDKDVEKLYTGTDSLGKTHSIANINLYPELYPDAEED